MRNRSNGHKAFDQVLSGGSIHFAADTSARTLCQLVSRTECDAHRCIYYELDQSSGVRIPTTQSNLSNCSQSKKGQRCNEIDRPTVVSLAVVATFNRITNDQHTDTTRISYKMRLTRGQYIHCCRL